MHNLLFPLLHWLAAFSSPAPAPLELRLDFAERRTEYSQRDSSVTYFLHYTVTNTAPDTLTYITNSCFYYNRCFLTVDGHRRELNPDGGCHFNAETCHRLPPGGTAHIQLWIAESDTAWWSPGWKQATAEIPLVQDAPQVWRVDGRRSIERDATLRFTGKIMFVQSQDRPEEPRRGGKRRG